MSGILSPGGESPREIEARDAFGNVPKRQGYSEFRGEVATSVGVWRARLSRDLAVSGSQHEGVPL